MFIYFINNCIHVRIIIKKEIIKQTFMDTTSPSLVKF